ncbi:MAG: peptidylprolyl isomerase, partial [Porticoccaceae bacterium]
VNEFHYDGLIFHRVIKGFMIQTGGFTFDLSRRESPRPAIVNESLNGLKNKRGSVAMARMADPDSAEAQFFINHKSNRTLNARDDTMGYAVFGQVISGMEVVDAIAVVETQAVSFYRDVPVEAIRILSARLLNPEAWTPLPEPKRPETLSFERPIPIR